ncbi:hypothetical protein AgCh_019550 [Apium graveolens]
MRVKYPITTDCTNTSNDTPDVFLPDRFAFSYTENRFIAMGCDNLGLLRSRSPVYEDEFTVYGDEFTAAGCVSLCNTSSLKNDNRCFGESCCKTSFEPNLQHIRPSLYPSGSSQASARCRGPRYGFIVEHEWFKGLDDIYSVQTMKTVPVVLNINAYYICGLNAIWNERSCSCKEGYEGNPYLPEGCQGSYTCSCGDGWVFTDDRQLSCSKIGGFQQVKKPAIIVIATGAGLGTMLATAWWLYKVIRRRKIRKLGQKFFKRNGGLLLHQRVSSREGNVETTKLFTSKELEKATDQYNVNRIIGQGGLGTVYKGMLTDGRIVAVKKSKIEDESKLEHFINEVVILSQINHRNIVKLYGCCLETEVPLLVYEFIPNGTLMQYIHEQNEYFPLTWDARIRVATEVAGALYYLHSAASVPIYHRDIKSSNILLDDKYKAKVADFGTSRSISIDQTHLTTRVQGTFGYLDPEYFRSSQFTDKSDVYSFGVVLVELLTGQKPILAARLDDEARSLVTLFLLAMEENRILDILDSQIKEGRGEGMVAFANIAYRCLNLNGRRRPTMKQVVAELESIRNTNEPHSAQQHYEADECRINELNGSWDSDVTSTSTSSTVHHSLILDIDPVTTN